MTKSNLEKNSYLIGTPVHRVKDYCFKEWLESVKLLDGDWFLYMVDNSEDIDYANDVHSYCKELEITNYKIIHIDIDKPDSLPLSEDVSEMKLEKIRRAETVERVAKAREAIRLFFIESSYSHLFFLESDVICPPDTITKLEYFDDKFDVIMHNYPSRQFPEEETWGFGCTIIKRKYFNDYSFLKSNGGNWHHGEILFLKHITNGGGKWVELHYYLILKHLENYYGSA